MTRSHAWRALLRAAIAALPVLASLAAAAPDAPAQNARKKQEIIFAELPARNVGDAPFEIAAKATSGLPVALEIMSGPAALDGKKLKLAGRPGLVIIRATQPGDASYRPATPAERVLVVNPTPCAPTIVSQPSASQAEIGDVVFLAAEASGEPLPTLQWRKDGEPLPGATSHRLVIAPAALSDSGAYDVVASNAMGSATSERVQVTVGKRRQTIIYQGPFNAVVGVPVTLTANATSGLPVRFEVVSGSAVLSGATMTAQWAGAVVVRVSQPGDPTFAAAAPVDQSLPVTTTPAGR